MRKLLAIWAGKIIAFASRLTGGKSSSAPGLFALKLCPDLIKRLSGNIEKGIIVTCGTNGKTTTNNLLCTALEARGYHVVCNRLGANMLSGITTAFLKECSLLGRFHADYACLEVDEAYTVHVFDQITPDIMIITNLFRDQLDRYGEIDITTDILKRAIAKAPGAVLVLNADDPLCAQFGLIEGITPVYYGISEKVLPQQNDTKEGRFCPLCGEEQVYDYYHYSQLGSYHCPSCGFRRPEPDIDVRSVTLGTSMKFTINGEPMEIRYKGFYNIYNLAAVYAAITAAGESVDNFPQLLQGYQPQIGRMQEFSLGKPVILSLSKNPAGFNQAITTVCTDNRTKDVIIAINDNANDGKDVSWLWDVDFDKIQDSRLQTLTTTGIRMYDISLRFKYADVAVDFMEPDMKTAVKRCLKTDSQAVYLLVNYSCLYSTEAVLKELEKELGGGSSE